MIKVKDLAYVRYRTTDLDLMQQFLLDFGLVVTERTKNALYMRGTGPAHHCYITELAAQPGFIGFAFEAESERDLYRLAAELEGASQVENIDEPGGGKRVKIIDPTGYQLEIVHGINPLEELPTRPSLLLNTDRLRLRFGNPQRPPHGPAHVYRLGHLIIRTHDIEAMKAFYAQFGLRPSDEVYPPGEPEKTAVCFMKCDRGEDYTDHHTLGLADRRPVAVDHTAFECIDLDDVVLGGLHLQNQGYTRSWGVGRHYLGSQIFDYWRDPFGFKIEHWTDGDLVNQNTPVTRVPAGDDGPGAISQWGAQVEDHLKIYPDAESIGLLD